MNSSKNYMQEHVGSVDMKGFMPHWAANALLIPSQLDGLRHMQAYFQHLRPLRECVADDGRYVAHMMMEAVAATTRKHDALHALRMFVQRTAMLRDSGFPHMAAMLATIATDDLVAKSDTHGGDPQDDPASVTEMDAARMGGTLLAILAGDSAPSPAGAVQALVRQFKALGALDRTYVWFAPMLEVACQRRAPRSSHIARDLVRRLSTMRDSRVAPASSAADTLLSVVRPRCWLYLFHALLQTLQSRTAGHASVVPS
jgi:hypothetical protein